MDDWPVATSPVGDAEVATLLWRRATQLYVGVTVKASYRLADDAEMVPLAPQPVRTRDSYLPNGRSLAASRELLPPLGLVEVLVTGHAHSSTPTQKMTVRLAIEQEGEAPLLDKRLQVYGDRLADGSLRPFRVMPLCYERAIGGRGVRDNPVGLDPRRTSANIVDAALPTRPGAGMSPIPPSFPQRHNKLNGVPPDALAGDLLDLPTRLEPEYFLSAPPDQRLERLPVGAWLQLEGMHRDGPLRTRLPAVRAIAKVVTADGGAIPLRLRLELVHIEPDEDRCSLVWRGSFPVPGRQLLDTLLVAGGVESAPARRQPAEPPLEPPLAATVALPGHAPTEAGAQPDAAGDDDAGEEEADSTALVDAEPLPANSVAWPFPVAEPGQAGAASAPPGAPWSQEPGAAVHQPERFDEETTLIEVHAALSPWARSGGEQAPGVLMSFPPPPPPRSPVKAVSRPPDRAARDTAPEVPAAPSPTPPSAAATPHPATMTPAAAASKLATPPDRKAQLERRKKQQAHDALARREAARKLRLKRRQATQNKRAARQHARDQVREAMTRPRESALLGDMYDTLRSNKR